MTGALWQAVTFSGGTGIQAYRHYPGVFDPWWLSMLPLPDPDRAPAGQPVSLLAGRRIERYPGSVTERGRHTVALEDIGSGEDDGSGGEDKWYKLAAAHLTRLSGSDPRVTEDPGHSVHLAFAIDRDKQGSGIRPPERKRA